MPQAPTANMLLVKPTELGDSGVWASLLDAMFDLIDAHDHSTGKGTKVSMLNGVTVAADIPWSSAGTFYAITGLKAIDFQPRPQSEMTSFAGALFVDSANNELSYRTTGGAIIRFTNGSTFNFAAVGGIGGDYTSAGALVDFVDANDIYRFRQQLGGGVQQYARLDCGGVDLFEFKANPTAGVPGNRVRLSSPAALASSYEVTYPAALPAVKGLLAVDSTGVLTTTPTLPAVSGLLAISSAGSVTTSPAALPSTRSPLVVDATGVVTALSTQTMVLHAAAFSPENNYSTATINLGPSGWRIGAAPPNDKIMAAIPLGPGDRVVSIQWFFNKISSATVLTMTLNTRNVGTNTVRDTLSDVSSGAAVVSVTRTINYTTASGDALYMEVSGGGAIADLSHAIIVWDHP